MEQTYSFNLFITLFVVAKIVSNICVMKEIAISKQEIKIGGDLISIDPVKGDAQLRRVMINNAFKGYLQIIDGEVYRIDGSDIHNLIFARICHYIQKT